MIFDLIGHQRMSGHRRRRAHHPGIVIADSDMPHFSGIDGPIETLDLFAERHPAARPMDEKEINIVGLQFHQTFIDRGHEFWPRVIVDPHFRGDEDLISLDAGFAYGGADITFVPIHLCCIDVAETLPEGGHENVL